jgi:hypothetical protein
MAYGPAGGRRGRAGGERQDMPRLPFFRSERNLERQLLRNSDCGRTPLVGERVHHYARGTRVCELCRPRRDSEPEHSQLVRHGEGPPAVRLLARAA